MALVQTWSILSKSGPIQTKLSRPRKWIRGLTAGPLATYGTEGLRFESSNSQVSPGLHVPALHETNSPGGDLRAGSPSGPEPGHYVLSVQNWLATGARTGTLEVFGSVPGSETVVPAGIEAWTVSCTKPNGRLAGTEQIVVDRGQRKTVTVCKSGGKQPR